MTRPTIEELIAAGAGISLDVGCGEVKQPNYIGMDIRDLPSVDIVHDFEVYPWPLPDESCIRVLASHVVEHINPAHFGMIYFMDEVWRICKPDAQFVIAMPYPTSRGFYQDPTHCLLDGAEVLTESGFKRIEYIVPGEQILTLNPISLVSEFSPCIQVIQQDYDGDILRFHDRTMHIAVTPNHDLVWKTWQPNSIFRKGAADGFESLVTFARRGLATIPIWKGKSPFSIEIPKIDGDESLTIFDAGDFMEMLGWILTEGGFIKRGNYRTVRIHQSEANNAKKYERIVSLLERMRLSIRKYPNGIDILSRSLYEHLCCTGKTADRYIPIEYKSLSSELLARLLEGLILGDGSPNPHGGGNEFDTISEQLASDVNEIALKCGMRSCIRTRPGKLFLSPNGKKYNRKMQYRLSITHDRPMLYPKPKREHYSGKIVCVEVADNHTIMSRYDGYCAWVGNCNPRNEITWAYFDPLEPNTGGGLYRIYRPKPWKITHLSWEVSGNMEVLLEKRREDKSYYE